MSGATAYKVGKLIDGNGGEVVNNGVVVVENGLIKAVGASGDVEIPPNAVIIDEPNLTARHCQNKPVALAGAGP